ncbi:hypothetical protein SDC9_190397 [bioreactor metagenome]|uniref:Uncharacterized protein n=1 Tax=bioreactor metagenome TaxID=1076179 RepID=A0A645HXC4_9ZZZZ
MAQSILSLPQNKDEFLQSVSRALARPLSTLIITTKEEFEQKVRVDDRKDPFLNLLNENKERIEIQD